MTEEMKYYTGNCITDLHTDTSFSYCNEEKCKQYIKSDGLNFCMSSVCPEKDCIYALVYKLHQTIDRLEQENKELKEKIKDKPLQCLLYNDKQNKCALFTKTVAYHCALKEIRDSFKCFRTCIIPFHIGDKDKIPHSMADMIQDYCESIKTKIDEVLE